MINPEKKEDSDKYQPVTDRATAEVMKFAIKPDNRQDRRVFSHISNQAPFLLSVISPMYDFLESIWEAKLEEDSETGEIIFTINNEARNKFIPQILEDLLLLGPAVSGRRVEMLVDMIKNKNRPGFNPMAMLGGGFGNKSETDIMESDDGNNYPTNLD